EDDAKLSRVSVGLKSGQQSFKTTLKPRNVNGEWLPPKPVYWLLAADSKKPIDAKIRYRYKRRHNRVIDWEHNGKDLREIFPGLSIYLDEQYEED
ncbi:hypothetical protein THIOM_003270, partial [Candidatus Thiomargarita nelsonii]